MEVEYRQMGYHQNIGVPFAGHPGWSMSHFHLKDLSIYALERRGKDNGQTDHDGLYGVA